MALRNKQTSRVVLLLGATAIVALTLWSSGRIARTLRTEEQRKVELWSEAIVQRAELVRYTDALFASLRTEGGTRPISWARPTGSSKKLSLVRPLT